LGQLAEQVAPTARVSSAGHGRGVGLVDGETDGPLLGLFEGDWLGIDVGCEISCYMKKEGYEYKVSFITRR
jgi:hypothetical protein